MPKYSEDQPRDENGRFAGGGGTDTAVEDKPSSTGAGGTDAKFTKDGANGAVKMLNDMQQMSNLGGAVNAKTDNVRDNSARMLAQALSPGGEKLREQCANLGKQWLPDGAIVQRYGVDYAIAGMQRAGATSQMSPEEVGARIIATRMQDSWAGSASDSNPESLAMQFAIADKLGVSTESLDSIAKAEAGSNGWSAQDADRVREALGMEQTGVRYGTTNELARELAQSPGVRAYVDTAYDRTQAYFASRGITEVNLYRGVKALYDPELNVQTAIADFQKEPLGNQGVAARDVTLNPLSSFSLSEGTATAFAGQAFGDSTIRREGTAVLQASVPAERVFSYPGTGPGCLNEKEVVVVGGEARVGMILGAQTWDPTYGALVNGLSRDDQELAALHAAEPGHIEGYS